MTSWKWQAAALAATLVAADEAAAQAKIGQVPKFAFQQPIVNGLGVKSLEDLRGRPVIVEFWGTR